MIFRQKVSLISSFFSLSFFRNGKWINSNIFCSWEAIERKQRMRMEDRENADRMATRMKRMLPNGSGFFFSFLHLRHEFDYWHKFYQCRCLFRIIYSIRWVRPSYSIQVYQFKRRKLRISIDSIQQIYIYMFAYFIHECLSVCVCVFARNRFLTLSHFSIDLHNLTCVFSFSQMPKDTNVQCIV